MVAAAGQAFVHGTANQAEAVRTQADASVRIAEIESSKQIKLAELAHQSGRLGMKYGAVGAAALLTIAAAIVGGALYLGHITVATHTITAVGSAVAGYFAGRAKR